MNWLAATIGINIGFEFGVVLILFISYLENRNKVIYWWIIGWIFLTVHGIFNLASLYHSRPLVFFINDLCVVAAAVAFLESVGHMKYRIYGQHHWVSINVFIISALTVYYLTLFFKNYPLSDNFVSFVYGVCLVICSSYYFRSERIGPSTQFIFVGLLMSGIHSLIYPLWEPMYWFAPWRFVLAGLYSLIFGIGLMLQSFDNLLQRRVLSEMLQRKLSFIDKISKSITRPVNLDLILDDVLEKVLEMSDVECGCIYIFDERRQELAVKVSRGFSHRYIQHYGRLKKGEGIAGLAIAEKKLQVIDNLSNFNSAIDLNIAREEGIVAQVSMPLIIKGAIAGVMDIASREEKVFETQQLQLLYSIADVIAVSIENTKLYNNMEQIYVLTITALAKALDAKDAYTLVHSENVSQYVGLIARELNLPEPEVEKLKFACKLHDIGKIVIDDSILTKPDTLNDKEWEVMKTHPQKGADILEPLRYLYSNTESILELIKYHHERYDGKGYPEGHLSQNIPIGAKILAVADAYDAMVSNRSYRKALEPKKAREELLRCAGTQFDPEVVKAFIRALDKAEAQGNRS